ncbi:Uridylate kinase [Apiospora kogelbergensis]|uniref:Uridylate kinase n=2 Tax=Apiospora kogelbergensis TaxID=1337665 RepID=A0AAW0QWE7_9PEZI
MQRLLWRQAATRASARFCASASASTRSFVSSSAASRLSSSRLAATTKAATPISSPTLRSSPRRAYSSQPPPPNPNQTVKFWPFLIIIAGGFAGYAFLVKRRVEMPATDAPKTGRIGAPAKSTPTFNPDDVTVVFVLGGPGAGKGTQCAHLVKDYGFTHLSAGDLLRAEQDREGSEFGQMIKDYIKDGLIVPMEVTVQLLENAMTATVDPSGKGETAGKKGKFLIDGFPRKMDQAVKFEAAVCPAKAVLFYDCPEAEMERRLLDRGKTSGRADDNADSIRKRFRTFVETSMPVVDAFEKQGKVIKIDGTAKPEDVHKTTQQRIEAKLGREF